MKKIKRAGLFDDSNQNTKYKEQTYAKAWNGNVRTKKDCERRAHNKHSLELVFENFNNMQYGVSVSHVTDDCQGSTIETALLLRVYCSWNISGVVIFGPTGCWITHMGSKSISVDNWSICDFHVARNISHENRNLSNHNAFIKRACMVMKT